MKTQVNSLEISLFPKILSLKRSAIRETTRLFIFLWRDLTSAQKSHPSPNNFREAGLYLI